MTFREVRALLRPAVVAPRSAWPSIPAWWPTSDEPEHVRTAKRNARAHAEACMGPMDGRQVKVGYDTAEQPPPTWHAGEGFVYVLDRRASHPDRLIYRYSPADSPGHAAGIRAVEEAFAEVGPVKAKKAAREAAALNAERAH